MKLKLKPPAGPGRSLPRLPLLSGRQLFAFPLLGGLVTLAGVALAAVLVQVLLYSGGNDLLREREVAARADQFAGYANARVRALYDQLGRFAASPEVIDALMLKDAERIRALEGTMLGLLEHGLRLNLVPAGEAQADLAGDPPINFAAKDMIDRVESGTTMLPEAFTHQGRVIVYGIRPVQSGDGSKVIGTVFAVVGSGYFSSPLTAFSASDGQMQVIQQFPGGEPLTVVEYGDPGDPAALPVDRQLDAAHWSLRFAPAAHLNEASIASPTLLMLPIALVLGAVVLGSFLGYSLLTRRIGADGQALIQLVGRLRNGQRSRGDFQLALFDRIGAAIAEQVAATPVAPAPATDDITSFAAPAAPAAAAARPAATRPAPPADDDDDFLGIEVTEGDEDVVELDAGNLDLAGPPPPAPPAVAITESIFRAYDIRGIVERELGPDVVELIGQAIGSEAAARGIDRIAVACDGRLTSPELKAALARGLMATGRSVIDVGEVPTPLLYFATYALDTLSGVMVTGSHNPPEYNGLKVMLGGETLADKGIRALYERIINGDFVRGSGTLETHDIVEPYIARIVGDTAIAQSLKVVVDCGNGIAGAVAPALLAALGCEVLPLYCDVDGTFPNHHPDPADASTLTDLIAVVKAEQADLGLAFDGDGDRIGVVTNKGEIIWPDRLMMLFARDIVGRNPGADVIYDVKCSRLLNKIVSEYGGRPIMWKTGHSHIKAKIQQTGALLGGEFSGHICFLERWYGFDDALYAAARLLEIVGSDTRTAAELFSEFPVTVTTPEIKINTTEARKFAVIEHLAAGTDWQNGSITTIDGIRVDFSDGFGLIRASNTSPVLTARFEGDNPAALARIRDLFRTRLLAVDPSLQFPS